MELVHSNVQCMHRQKVCVYICMHEEERERPHTRYCCYCRSLSGALAHTTQLPHLLVAASKQSLCPQLTSASGCWPHHHDVPAAFVVEHTQITNLLLLLRSRSCALASRGGVVALPIVETHKHKLTCMMAALLLF